MENLWDGVKGIVKKNDHILVLVKQDGTLDLYAQGKSDKVIKLRGAK